ncbi:MAG: phosphoglycerate kinase [Deltaproteobacteria bacterium]|nr:MAG: phosphoglycerate kinase [Deltaproteobacteria bacterium]TDJ20652.1 MAG: phosphoglycerate kinase [Deltaproteobacteria bacterium]
MAVPDLDGLLADGVRGQRVLVRADLNVPLSNGTIRDDSRVRASVPTLRRLADAGARVIVTSHLGRPKGQRKPELTLRRVAPRLAERIGRGVSFCEECIGEKAAAAVAELGDGQILLLENVRFHAGEEKNETGFAADLAALADLYVNDAFGTAHRAHASTTGIASLVDRAVAGDLLRSELEHLRVVRDPERPLLVLLGGAKVSSKLAVMEALAPHADVLAIGGAMAYTFIAAAGKPTGASRVEQDMLEDANCVVEAVRAAGRRLLIPTDHLVAKSLEAGASTRVVETIPDGWIGVDIGPETARRYAEEAAKARTIFWNGPMGVFEIQDFAAGTARVAEAVASSDATTVVGGGDSLAAIQQLGFSDRITHLSTGGGASLEFVQGLALPGVAALER